MRTSFEDKTLMVARRGPVEYPRLMQELSLVRRGAVLASVLLLLGAGGAPLAAQKPTPSGVTELIDFLVVGDDGTPITDLTAQDVTLKVDG
jgi:hypothetical protein